MHHLQRWRLGERKPSETTLGLPRQRAITAALECPAPLVMPRSAKRRGCHLGLQPHCRERFANTRPHQNDEPFATPAEDHYFALRTYPATITVDVPGRIVISPQARQFAAVLLASERTAGMNEQIQRHVLRVSRRRCERTVEIQTADAIRLNGKNAVWKQVAQRLLDDTSQQRTSRHEEDIRLRVAAAR
jgi:hypothetical protein